MPYFKKKKKNVNCYFFVEDYTKVINKNYFRFAFLIKKFPEP